MGDSFDNIFIDRISSELSHKTRDSDSAIQSNRLIPLGKEMVQAKMNELPSPRVASEDPRDNPKLKAIKSLIREMTQYRPADRKPMKDVLRVIEHVDGGRI